MASESLTNYDGVEYIFDIFFFHEFKGRGGYNIMCNIDFEGNQKTFRCYTTDTEFIDNINKLKAEDESLETIQEAYKENFFEEFKELILEFCESEKN